MLQMAVRFQLSPDHQRVMPFELAITAESCRLRSHRLVCVPTVTLQTRPTLKEDLMMSTRPLWRVCPFEPPRCFSFLLLLILALFLICLTGCQNETSPVPEAASSDSDAELPAERTDPKSRALAAKQALFEKLSTRLLAAMSSGGPAAAIEVCSREASQIAAEVSEEHGLKIGRTSFKLRNPQNSPPAWTQHFVDERIAEPQFVDLEDGQFGAFLPIKLQPQCLTCHGPEDQIDPQVLSKLDELYPDDNATGFHLDELRGWFWIEVPSDSDQVQ